MASSNFVDYVKVFCRSGKGGGGSVHFYRGRAIPFGGPDGGNGGRGGHVILRGNRQLWTLLHLKYTKHIMAKDGESGKIVVGMVAPSEPGSYNTTWAIVSGSKTLCLLTEIVTVTAK